MLPTNDAAVLKARCSDGAGSPSEYGSHCCVRWSR
ncbi:Uncharacterised protein [Mycobacteroides abscessus]|nr:Uncharacterised protein [Mycobacteroides abscessus]